MKTSSCCKRREQARAVAPTRRPTSRWKRGGEFASWILPSAALALIPKCPACVAGYVALATGIGISLPAAAYIRGSLIAMCLASLAYLVARRLRRLKTARASIVQQ